MSALKEPARRLVELHAVCRRPHSRLTGFVARDRMPERTGLINVNTR